MSTRSRSLGALCALAFFLVTGSVAAQSQTTWYMAEGATGSFFEEEILIGNPNAGEASITITYLQPGGVAAITQTFTMAPTSRRTVRVNAVAGLASANAVSAIVQCTNGLDIVVERSMYWANGTRRGGHNSQAVAAPATRWYLAEGSTGFFDAFVLVANPDQANGASVRVTFLREDGTTVAFPEFVMPPNSRSNIWVNQEVPALAGRAFSTIVESTSGTPIFVERAMYFGGSPWEGGHESVGVTQPSTTWFFGEGFTGGTAALQFDTFVLLSNPGTSAASVTMTFLREGLPSIERQYDLLPTSRQNVWVDLIPGLESAPFSVRIQSTHPIIAERAEYWGPVGNWLEAHNTPGVTSDALAWAFAEGAEDGLDTSGLDYDSYFLVANASTNPLSLRATFVREDGTGIVQTYTVAPGSRFTLPTSSIPELSNQRFAAFFESTNAVPFVVERAMYWGQGYFGGHASTGTPWTGAIATPAATPVPAISAVVPSAGGDLGGDTVTITGTNLRAGSTVTFGGTPATNVVVVNSTTIRAVTPPRPVGVVDVVVNSPSSTGTTAATLFNAFTYVPSIRPPVITNIAPVTGPTTGGNDVYVTGQNLTGATSVTLGGIAVTSFTVLDPFTIRIRPAPHAAGAVDLVVVTSAGRAERANAYTYVSATATDNILAFGDSNTEGVVASSCSWVILPTSQSLHCDFTTDGAFPNSGYPNRLRGLLQSAYPRQVITVNNGGCGGDYTGGPSGSCQGGRQGLPSTIRASNDLVIIMEGVNDLNAGVPYGTIVDNLRTMVQTAKNAGKLVMLGTVLPVVTVVVDGLPYTKADNAAIDELNRRIRIVAGEQQVTLVDFHQSFTSYGNMSDLFSADGLHPNAAGYTRMAQRVYGHIVPAFETIPPIVP